MFNYLFCLSLLNKYIYMVEYFCSDCSDDDLTNVSNIWYGNNGKQWKERSRQLKSFFFFS